jgi:N-acetylglucosamine kinase-like BadF-type ATPase
MNGPGARTERIVLGVDGGGTRTRVALATEAGRVLGVGQAGPGNYHDVGPEAVRDHVAAALERAWEAAGAAPRPIDAAFLGLASIVSPADRAVARRIGESLDLNAAGVVDVGHDLRVALAGALAGRPGIVLIAGTGSSCYGRTADGRSWRAGGWGSLLDDLGSSRELGLQAMVAATRDADGRGPPTVLRARVLQALELDDIERLPARADAQGFTRRELAALAPLVTAAAADGDLVATEIIQRAARDLAAMVAAVVRKLGFDDPRPVPLAITGGLAATGAVILEPLRRAVACLAPRCELVEPKLPPVLGAACLALQRIGRPSDAAVVEELARTAPTDAT